jgi:hypothetical protein
MMFTVSMRAPWATAFCRIATPVDSNPDAPVGIV